MNYNPYKKRWIAIVRNRVVGVGLNSEQAYQTAKVNCPKDRPRLFFVDETGLAHMQPDNFKPWFDHDLLKQIVELLQQKQQEAYLVGGAVRDGLLGQMQPESDLDLLVPQNALSVARKLANDLKVAYYPVDAKRDVGRIVFDDYRHIDISAYRGQSLLEDLQHRDFTINAIALNLDLTDPKIIDPLAGQTDLEQKIVSVVSDTAIQEDPVRSLRAVRLAAKFGFSIAPQTQTLITAEAINLKNVSPERIRDEMLKLLQLKNPGHIIATLHHLALLPHILPEVMAMVGVAQSSPHHLNVFEHSLLLMNYCYELLSFDDVCLAKLAPVKSQLLSYFQTQLAGNVSRAELMPLAALLHDIGKPNTFVQGSDARIRFWRHPQVGAEISKEILSRWNLSSQAIQFVVGIVTHHMRPLLLAHQQGASQRAIHRFLEATGKTAPAIAFFSLLDHLSTYKAGQGQAEWEQLLTVVLQICQTYFAPKYPPLLSGRDIMKRLNIASGPQVGVLLRKLKEAQAVGEVSNRNDALKFIETLKQS